LVLLDALWFITGLSTNEEISRLFFADEQCLLTCGRNSGTLTVWDLRAGVVVFELPRVVQTMESCSLTQSHMAWTCDWRAHTGPMTTLLLLSSDGHVSIVDIRNACQNRDVLSLSTGQTFSDVSHDHMTIRVSSLYVRFCQWLLCDPSLLIGGHNMDCILTVCRTVSPWLSLTLEQKPLESLKLMERRPV